MEGVVFKSCRQNCLMLCVCSGQNMLCHLVSDEEGSVAHATVKHAGLTPKQYHSEALQKV